MDLGPIDGLGWEDWISSSPASPVPPSPRPQAVQKEPSQGRKAKPRHLTRAEVELVREAHSHFQRAVRMHSNLAMRSGLGSLEDAAQELTLVFAQRLVGDHPFDPTLASLGHYCVIMTRSVLINRLNRRRRHAVGHHGIVTEFGDREARLDEDVISEVLDPELGPEWMGILAE